jgi:hypothetical protein
MKMIDFSNGGKGGNDKIIKFILYPRKEPILTVITTPQMGLIDYVVYTLSTLNFWYGFCPLTLFLMCYKGNKEGLQGALSNDVRGMFRSP